MCSETETFARINDEVTRHGTAVVKPKPSEPIEVMNDKNVGSICIEVISPIFFAQ